MGRQVGTMCTHNINRATEVAFIHGARVFLFQDLRRSVGGAEGASIFFRKTVQLISGSKFNFYCAMRGSFLLLFMGTHRRLVLILRGL